MAELSLRVLTYVLFNLPPVALVVTYFLAGSADRQKATQFLNLCQRLLQLYNKLFAIFFRLLCTGSA